MLSLIEVAERSQKGPKVDQKAWDLGLFRRMTELVKCYEIAYPGDGSCVNLDEALPARVLAAAVDFLATDGVYCVTTGRVIHFTEAEVRQAIREIPSKVVVGEGRDRRTIRQGKVDGLEPLNHMPGHHAPFSEELAPLVVKNFAQIPTADYLEGFNFAATDGREIFGMPMEAYAARRAVAWMREGVRRAGRPGLAIAYYPINTRAAVLIAPMDPEAGLRRSDGVLLAVLPDVKVEHDLLTAAIVYEEYGCFKVNSGGGCKVGGFCGGLEGSVIGAVLQSLAGWLVYHDVFNVTGVQHIVDTTSEKIGTRKPGLLWGSSVVLQALNRHTPMASFCAGPLASGPGTRSGLIELAITSLVSLVNGGNISHGRQHRARMNAAQDPLMPEWKIEVVNAAIRAGLNRERADPLLFALQALITDQPVERGVSDVRECYDWVNHLAKPEYETIYLGVKEELAKMGLAFAN